VVQVKERLTGAIILVALIVLLVPELLTGPLRSAPRAAAVARVAGEPPLRSYTINLADERQAHGAAAQGNGPQQPAPLAQAAPTPPLAAAEASTPATTAQTPSPDSTALSPPVPPAPRAAAVAPTRSPAPPPPVAAGGGAGAWMVQLGSFASHSNAEHLARAVRAQGFAVSVSQGSSGRRLYRVRVGPVHDRAAANALAQKLAANGHSGAIVPK
jgi:DedD protein